MLNKLRKSRYTQKGCVTSNYQNALDMLDYTFNGEGYVYWFGSYWAIYTR